MANKKGMSHSESGIRKAPSVPVYPRDITGDLAIMACDGHTIGMWAWTLILIFSDEVCELGTSVELIARYWHLTIEETCEHLNELFRHAVCDVVIDGQRYSKGDENHDVTKCHVVGHEDVTVINRRRERQLQSRIAAQKRQKRHREKAASHKCHKHVTPTYTPPSSSPSPSPSTSNDVEGGEAPHLFLNELQKLQDAKVRVKDRLVNRYRVDTADGKAKHPEEYERWKQLKQKISDLDDRIANYDEEPTD